MEAIIHEWCSLFVRWAHLIAGIAWIGSSFYFIWLDSNLETPKSGSKSENDSVEGFLWMVHSGGFYQVERRKIAAGQMPKTLHWFKWEATITWLTGFLLLWVVYYSTDGAYLVDQGVLPLTPLAATGIGIGALVGSWFVYDALWQSRLAKNEKIAGAISLGLVCGMAYFLAHVFSGRGAYIHMGAIFGTLMVLNVWVRILPAQQKMIDATKAGRKVDFTPGKHAKRRSVHNTYMTFPVLFLMLSNHYPSTFGHKYNWVVLLLLSVAGAGVRHVMVGRNKSARWAFVPVAAALAAFFSMSIPEGAHFKHHQTMAVAGGGPRVSFAQARELIGRRCIECHSANPTDETFRVAPNGIMYDTPAQMKALAERIKVRAVVLKTMPFNNETGMTDDERKTLGLWVDQGATLE